jgi:hypothetical protein
MLLNVATETSGKKITIKIKDGPGFGITKLLLLLLTRRTAI